LENPILLLVSDDGDGESAERDGRGDVLMAEKEFVMRLHGDMLHNMAIFLLKCVWLEKGGKLLDERQFKKKYISPCEPDFFGLYEDRMVKGSRRWTEKKLLVAEVETHATAESVRKKQQQYEQASAGIQLVVLDLDEYLMDAGNLASDWMSLKNWIESKLPI
jgi:hypothetical protein